MADGKVECPRCDQLVDVVRLGNRVSYRPHLDKNGNKCPYRGRNRK